MFCQYTKPFVPVSSCHISLAKPQFWGTQSCPFLVPALRQPDLGRKSTVWQIDSTRTHYPTSNGPWLCPASLLCLFGQFTFPPCTTISVFPSLLLSPAQSFSTRGNFDLLPHLQPPGDTWQCLKMVLIITPAGHGNCCWHLVGKGQVCSSTSYKAQDGLTQYRIIWPNRSVVERSRNGL